MTTDTTRAPTADNTVEIGSFRLRLLAGIIDAVLIGFFTFLAATAVGFAALFLVAFNPFSELPFDTITVLCAAVVALIFYVSSWTKSGQTIGKQLTGLKVVGDGGVPVSTGKALLRFVGYIISAVPLSLGFIWIVFDKKGQGWHDKLSGTYVVTVNQPPFQAGAAQFLVPEAKRRWGILIVWLVLAIVAPGCLLGTLFVAGPVFARAIASLFGLQ
jgi:uncharacterized RDD family membrane protein YckC